MASIVITVFAGVGAIGFFLIWGIGMFFAFRKFNRFVQKKIFYYSMKQDHKDLIDAFIEGSSADFKRELYLLNTFTEKEVRCFVYAFLKRKRKLTKLKGGKKNGR